MGYDIFQQAALGCGNNGNYLRRTSALIGKLCLFWNIGLTPSVQKSKKK